MRRTRECNNRFTFKYTIHTEHYRYPRQLLESVNFVSGIFVICIGMHNWIPLIFWGCTVSLLLWSICREKKWEKRIQRATFIWILSTIFFLLSKVGKKFISWYFMDIIGIQILLLDIDISLFVFRQERNILHWYWWQRQIRTWSQLSLDYSWQRFQYYQT